MAWVAVAAAAISIASSVYGAVSGSRSSKKREQRRIANLTLENTEKIRKTKLDQEQTLATTKARAGASGVSLQSETVNVYLDEMKKNFQKDIDWINLASRQGINVAQQEGGDARRQSNARAFGQVAKGAADIYKAFQ